MSDLKYYYTKDIGDLNYNVKKVNLLKHNDEDVYQSFASQGYSDATVRVRAYDENSLPLTSATITLEAGGVDYGYQATLDSGVTYEYTVAHPDYFPVDETGLTEADTFDDIKIYLKKKLFVNYTSTDGNIITPAATPFDVSISGNVYNAGVGSFVVDALPTAINNGAFQDKTTLHTFDVPETVLDYGNNVFKGCTGLEYAVISNQVSGIGESVFENCTGIKDVSIGKGVITLPKKTFMGCTSLSGVSFGRGVLILDDKAFAGCTSLSSVTLPNNIYKLNTNVFSGDTNLLSIKCLALRAPDIAKTSLEGLPMGGILYTLRGSFDYEKWMSYLKPLGWIHKEVDV